MATAAKKLTLLLLLVLPFGLQADGFFSSNTLFSNDDSFLPVTEAYKLHIAEAHNNTALQWQIADGYYLYGHQFKAAFISDNGRNIPITLHKKAGIVKDDPYFGSVEVYYNEVLVELIPTQPLDKPINGTITVTSQGCADAGLCYPPYTESLPLTLQPASGNTLTDAKPSEVSPSTQKNSTTLLVAALFAFLGGGILNLMPCVFPILSLKVLAFAGKDPATSRVKSHGLAYTVGVIASFVITALLFYSLKASGSLIGWGFQLQSSRFVMALALLFFVLGLSLIGLLSFTSRWASIGDNLTQKGGLQGSFFTGVLAVMVASPCTAPFMGVAMAYALTQPLVYSLFIFSLLGLGMASPFLLISFIPSLSNRLPKPGAWMETLKQLLAFPLLLTSIWLLWILGNQTNITTVAATLCFFTLIAFAAWIKAKINSHFIRAILLPLLLTSATAALIISPALHSSTQALLQVKKNTWSNERLDQLLSEGKPVFVNVTADWCITCLANEQTTLQSKTVKQAFANNNITYLVADWTRNNPDITTFLAKHGRAGVPLYLYFPANPSIDAQNRQTSSPIMLPQILNPNIVLTAIGYK